MLKSIGVQWALAGHSERRTLFGETDAYINGQCVKLMEEGMAVMLCIGESLEEYEKDLAGAVCAVQLKKGLCGISKEDLARVAIAYERKFSTRIKSHFISIFNLIFLISCLGHWDWKGCHSRDRPEGTRAVPCHHC